MHGEDKVLFFFPSCECKIGMPSLLYKALRGPDSVVFIFSSTA